MATRVTGSKFKNYYTPWFSYDITANNATTYTFKLNLGVVSTKTVASQCGSGSRINKKVGSGSWTGTTVGHIVDLPAKSDTTVLSNDVWSVTKTHTTQTVTIDGLVSALDSGTDIGHATKTFTIPARTSYPVTYNANSGSGAPAQQTKWYGEALTLSSAKPTKDGYTFKGWATSEANAKIGTVNYASGGTVGKDTNSALNLWAVWELTYSKPTITNLRVERCDASGKPDDGGTLALVTFNWDVFRSSATRYYNGSTTPYTSTAVQSCSVTVGNETVTPTLTAVPASVVVGSNGSFLNDTQYNASVTITDTVDSAIQPSHSSTVTVTLLTTFFPMDFNEDASALGFFRPAPDSGDGDGVYFGKSIYIDGCVMAQDMAGMIQMFAGAVTQTVTSGVATTTGAPAGWLLCDGSVLNKSDYPELAAVLGSLYGGNGTTTFALPDMRGRFPLGVSTSHPLNGTGSTGGSENAIVPYHRHGLNGENAAASSANASHTHATGTGTHYMYRDTDGASSTRSAVGGSGKYTWTSGSANGFLSSTNTASANAAHGHSLVGNSAYAGSSGNTTGANMPPYRTVNFIIATGKTS